MNPAEFNLQPLHAPPAPWAWLPTPFEWGLLTLAFLVALYLLRYGYRASQEYRELERWRRVRKELIQRFADDPSRAAETTSRVIRKLAGRLDPDPRLGVLTGEAWLKRLDILTESQFFTKGDGRSLLDAPFTRSLEGEQVSQLLASFDHLLNVYTRRPTLGLVRDA